MTKGNEKRDEGTPDTPDHAPRRRGRRPRTEPGPEQYEAIRLRFARKTQKEIAERLSVDPKTISRWLSAPDVKREVAKHLEDVATGLWAEIAAEGPATLKAFVAALHCGDPRIELRARTWLMERLLEIVPMPRLIEEGLLAKGAVPPKLQPGAVDPEEEEEEEEAP